MNIQYADFSLAETHAGVGVNIQTIKAWLNKGYPAGENIKGGGGRGLRRRFTIQTIMEMAVANAIAENTFGTRDMGGCFVAARRFAHTGENGRMPGIPFHHNLGETYILVAPDSTAVVLDDDELTFAMARAEIGGGQSSFIALDASSLFRHVVDRLPITQSAEQLMDSLYPEEATD